MSKLVHKMIHNELGLKALSVQYVASAAHDVIIQCSTLHRCYTKISWNIFTQCLALHTLGHQYYYAPWFSRDTIQRFSARQDSMRVLKFGPSCLDVIQICLSLCVITLSKLMSIYIMLSKSVCPCQQICLFQKLCFDVRQCHWHLALHSAIHFAACRPYLSVSCFSLAGYQNLPKFSKDFKEVFFRHRLLM